MIAGITASTRRFQGGGFVIKTTDGVVAEIEGPGEVPGTGVSVDAYGQITGGSQLEEVLAWPEEKPDWLEGDGFMFSYATNLTKVPDTLPAWITDMTFMFAGCSNFNQDLSSWDTGNVIYMSNMFEKCPSFNGDLSGWDTSNVLVMTSVFRQCSNFNQDLSSWDTSKVTDMAYMFAGCSNFNQDLSSWDTGNVTSMSSIFTGCSSFNGDISSWDTSNVIDMSNMFEQCPNFNGDLSGWDTSEVKYMSSMFEKCSNFNQDLSSWDTSKVTNTSWMSWMFQGCSSFNQDLSGWCVSNISSEPSNFSGAATSWTLPKPVWGTCPQEDSGGESEPDLGSGPWDIDPEHPEYFIPGRYVVSGSGNNFRGDMYIGTGSTPEAACNGLRSAMWGQRREGVHSNQDAHNNKLSEDGEWCRIETIWNDRITNSYIHDGIDAFIASGRDPMLAVRYDNGDEE